MTGGARRVRRRLLPWQRGQGKVWKGSGGGVCVRRGLPCTWHPGEMPPSGSGMRPRAGGGCLLAFEGRGVHRRSEGAAPLGGLSGGLWYWDCSADSRGAGGGGRPAWARSSGTWGPDRPGGTRRCAPRRRQGTPHPPRSKWPPFEDPLGGGVGSCLEDERVESESQQRGGGCGRGEPGPRDAGAACRGGSRGPWGRASGAGACGGCTSGNLWRLGGRRWSCRKPRGGGAASAGKTGWSEVPRAAWAGSAEGSAGSPGAAAGRRAGAGFPRGPGSASSS